MSKLRFRVVESAFEKKATELTTVSYTHLTLPTNSRV